MHLKSIRTIVNIIKAGLYIIPATALIIAGGFYGTILLPGVGDLFFPFITGKHFFFRIIVEVIFVLWVFAATFDKRYRPKRSFILYSLISVVVALTLATIFGENPYRSFWSYFERMEGLIFHLHLFAFFLVMISTLIKESDWRTLFGIHAGVSAILSFYAYLQLAGALPIHQGATRIDATLGNATYLAIFIIFNLFLLAYLYATTRETWVKVVTASIFLFNLPIIFLTATRGATLGLLGGVLLTGIILSITSGQKRIRNISFGMIAALILIATAFWSIRNTQFIQSSPVFSRFANISLEEQKYIPFYYLAHFS